MRCRNSVVVLCLVRINIFQILLICYQLEEIMKWYITLITLILFDNSIAQTGFIETYAGDGIAGYSGDGGSCAAAQLHTPAYITLDNFGNLFIVDFDNNVIRKINTLGIISTIAGNGIQGYGGDNGPATAANLSAPTGVACDRFGNLYIADWGNNLIRKVNSSGIITTVAGIAGGVGGYSGDNGLAFAARLNEPAGITLDYSGNIYFSDLGNYRVRKINTDGVISTIAGNGTPGYSGDNGPATAAQFVYLGYLAVSSSDEVYVADWENRRVRKVSTLGIVTTVAGNGLVGNSGDDGAATNAKLNAPNAVNFDDSGNYYISDNLAHVIRKVNPSGIISTVVGNGTMGFSGDGGPATAAQLNRPNSVIFNSSGNMYFADGYNNRIRKITYHPEPVKEITKQQNILSLFPNPTGGKMTIAAPDKIENVVITNIVGQLLFKCAYLNPVSTSEINVENLVPGIYYLRVNNLYQTKFVRN